MGDKYGLADRIMSSNTHKCTIFLGDNLQRLNKESDDGIAYIKDKILEYDKKLDVFRFTSSVGIPPEILKNIKYLLGDETIVNPHFLGEYNIKIYNDKTEFLTSYKNDNHKNRHLATIHYPENNFSNIGDYEALPRELKNSDYPYFLNNEVIENYYLSPYELISREVESVYVYVRENVTEKNLQDFIFYQLYILMTRATISLNIYCENIDLREMFEIRLKEIKDFSASFDDSIEGCVKEGQFEVRESIFNQFVSIYDIDTPRAKIESRSITRLVHFTSESNIASIKKYGILPRTVLDENGYEYDYNDLSRMDSHKDAICLSVENPNHMLLGSFKRDNDKKKFKLITINPSILYSSFIKDDGIKLVPRKYCNYNAAAKLTKSDDNDLDIMFSEKVETRYGIFTRDGMSDNQTTCCQAEILFFGRIPPEYIESIEDI